VAAIRIERAPALLVRARAKVSDARKQVVSGCIDAISDIAGWAQSVGAAASGVQGRGRIWSKATAAWHKQMATAGESKTEPAWKRVKSSVQASLERVAARSRGMIEEARDVESQAAGGNAEQGSLRRRLVGKLRSKLAEVRQGRGAGTEARRKNNIVPRSEDRMALPPSSSGGGLQGGTNGL
jgi:hypothetical protein